MLELCWQGTKEVGPLSDGTTRTVAVPVAEIDLSTGQQTPLGTADPRHARAVVAAAAARVV